MAQESPAFILDQLRTAATSLMAGDPVGAARAMAAIAFSPMQSEKRPTLTPRLQAEVLRRDAFTCRYCDGPTVPPIVLRVFSTLFPIEFPYQSNWRRDACHVAYWRIASSIDHIVPGTEGGAWLDPANLVTACWVCNGRKANLRLDEMGWSLLPVAESGWDGLSSIYPRLWQLAGKPSPTAHAPWLRAFT